MQNVQENSSKYSNKIITMAAGAGGKTSKALISSLILPALSNDYLEELGDGAVFSLGADKLAFTTDSFVVSPLFFPGGSIGDLAVNGTVNDLAACGARPLVISLALILEEGFRLESLERIVHSIQEAAAKAGVKIVTGDTKVVERGKGDGCYINTSGIGIVNDNAVSLGPSKILAEDEILVTGPIGDHGTTIMLARGDLGITADISSDTAPLADPIAAVMEQCANAVHAMRDPTRGGLATVLNEMAESSKVGIEIAETDVPVRQEVRAVSELLGIDPLYIASEGRMVIFAESGYGNQILEILRTFPQCQDAALIGKAVDLHPGFVVEKTIFGGERIIDLLVGDPLPRIC